MRIPKSDHLIPAVVAAFLTFLGQSDAAIVSVDDPVYGSHSITRDEISGLEWLNWTVTTNRSFQNIVGHCRPGGDFPGFRHATRKELLELYTHIGVPNVNAPNPNRGGNTQANFSSVSGFLEFFGLTESFGPLVESTAAIFGESYELGHRVTSLGRILESFSGFEANTAFALISPHSSIISGREDDYHHSFIGHALVRSPAASDPPSLTITHALNNVTISWFNVPDKMFMLEESSSQGDFVWVSVSSGPQNPTTLSITSVARYFRLRQVPTNMVWIPPGMFMMGSTSNEAERHDWEGPQTVVTLTRGFFMGRYEVTQAECLAVLGENPSYFNGGVWGTDLNRPVDSMTWLAAVAYCEALTQRELQSGRLPFGWRYRLPTEAEWEYACRAGTTTAFHYGTALRSGMANFVGSSEYDSAIGTIVNGQGTYLQRTTTVGSYGPNAWGLYDMHGNILEWCQDWWSSSLSGGSITDPQGPVSDRPVSFVVALGSMSGENVGQGPGTI